LSAVRADLSDADAKEAIVRLSPSGQSVEVLANLSLERKGASSKEDAQARIEGL